MVQAELQLAFMWQDVESQNLLPLVTNPTNVATPSSLTTIKSSIGSYTIASELMMQLMQQMMMAQ